MDMFVSQVGSVHSIPFPGSLALLTFGDPLYHLTIRQNLRVSTNLTGKPTLFYRKRASSEQTFLRCSTPPGESLYRKTSGS